MVNASGLIISLLETAAIALPVYLILFFLLAQLARILPKGFRVSIGRRIMAYGLGWVPGRTKGLAESEDGVLSLVAAERDEENECYWVKTSDGKEAYSTRGAGDVRKSFLGHDFVLMSSNYGAITNLRTAEFGRAVLDKYGASPEIPGELKHSMRRLEDLLPDVEINDVTLESDIAVPDGGTAGVKSLTDLDYDVVWFNGEKHAVDPEKMPETYDIVEWDGDAYVVEGEVPNKYQVREETYIDENDQRQSRLELVDTEVNFMERVAVDLTDVIGVVKNDIRPAEFQVVETNTKRQLEEYNDWSDLKRYGSLFAAFLMGALAAGPLSGGGGGAPNIDVGLFLAPLGVM